MAPQQWVIGGQGGREVRALACVLDTYRVLARYVTPASMIRMDLKGQLTHGNVFDEAYSDVDPGLTRRLSEVLGLGQGTLDGRGEGFRHMQ